MNIFDLFLLFKLILTLKILEQETAVFLLILILAVSFVNGFLNRIWKNIAFPIIDYRLFPRSLFTLKMPLDALARRGLPLGLFRRLMFLKLNLLIRYFKVQFIRRQRDVLLGDLINIWVFGCNRVNGVLLRSILAKGHALSVVVRRGRRLRRVLNRGARW